MHIPDGYLSPRTCVAFYAAMAPVWWLAVKRLEKGLEARELSLLSLAAAFAFLIMMFNFPLPGGTVGHMTGASITAILFGPWAAVLAMTLVITLQALLFGDGGITTLGANAFNMAFVSGFSSFAAYSVMAPADATTRRRVVASGLAAYVGVNLSALAAGIELGIQPMIASTPEGSPLYSPYPLGVAVPAVMAAHLFFIGPVEAMGTSLVVSCLVREKRAAVKNIVDTRPLWAIAMLLAISAPLGLMATGAAWGEWTPDEIEGMMGFVPQGMARLSGLWEGLVPGGYQGPEDATAFGRVARYAASALMGSIVAVGLVFLVGRLWKRR